MTLNISLISSISCKSNIKYMSKSSKVLKKLKFIILYNYLIEFIYYDKQLNYIIILSQVPLFQNININEYISRYNNEPKQSYIEKISQTIIKDRRKFVRIN